MKYDIGTFNELKNRVAKLQTYSHYDISGYVRYCLGFDIQRCENVVDNFNRFTDKELKEIYDDIVKRIENVKDNVIEAVRRI